MVNYPEPFRGKIFTNNCTIQGSIKTRDILKARINDNDGYVLYILMNPSKADSIQSDRTINKILTFTRNESMLKISKITGIGNVHIINLFSVYKTDSSQLNSILKMLGKQYEKVVKNNNMVIEDEIKNAKYIVLAWGNVPKNMDKDKHRHQVNKVYDFVRNANKMSSVFVLKVNNKSKNILTNDMYPRHPARAKILNLVKCEIDEKNVLKTVLKRVPIKFNVTIESS